MFVFQSLASFLKKVAFLRKNLKVDNFFNIIKHKTRQKKNSNIVEKIWFATQYGQQQTAPIYIFNYHLGKKRASLIGIFHEFLEELGIRSKK